MKIVVFTANQPRHLFFLEILSEVFEDVTAVIEAGSVFPGQTQDLFSATAVMEQYFRKMCDAEDQVFGGIRKLPSRIDSIIMRFGDLSRIDTQQFEKIIDADLVILAGASYLQGDLCKLLVEKQAINVHMGICPEYRGRHCNFWAVYDGHPHLVGGTVHRISTGLDTGDVLFHAFPRPQPIDPFELGMRAFEVVHEGLLEKIENGELFTMEPVAQKVDRRLRYSKNKDFDDAVAADYLNRLPTPAEIEQRLNERDLSAFVRPYVA